MELSSLFRVFTIYQTFNGGWRAVDTANGKVEPLVAGEASYDAAETKLRALYANILVFNDQDNIFELHRAFARAIKDKKRFARHFRQLITAALMNKVPDDQIGDLTERIMDDILERPSEVELSCMGFNDRVNISF